MFQGEPGQAGINGSRGIAGDPGDKGQQGPTVIKSLNSKIKRFSTECYKTKTKLKLWLSIKVTDNPVNQLKLKANTAS